MNNQKIGFLNTNCHVLLEKIPSTTIFFINHKLRPQHLLYFIFFIQQEKQTLQFVESLIICPKYNISDLNIIRKNTAKF